MDYRFSTEFLDNLMANSMSNPYQTWLFWDSDI